MAAATNGSTTKQAETAFFGVGGNHVGMRIRVHVTSGQHPRHAPGVLYDADCQTATPIAEQDRDSGRIEAPYKDVLQPILVGVGHGTRGLATQTGVSGRRLGEGPVAAVERDGDAVGRSIGRHDVKTAVAVEIQHAQRAGYRRPPGNGVPG